MDRGGPVVWDLRDHPHFGGRWFRPQGYATNVFWRAVRAGLAKDLRGQPCNDCGKTSKHHDHRDYYRPLDVEPVCHSCNLRRGSAAPYSNPLKRTPRRGPHPINGFAMSMLEATTEPFE